MPGTILPSSNKALHNSSAKSSFAFCPMEGIYLIPPAAPAIVSIEPISNFSNTSLTITISSLIVDLAAFKNSENLFNPIILLGVSINILVIATTLLFLLNFSTKLTFLIFSKTQIISTSPYLIFIFYSKILTLSIVCYLFLNLNNKIHSLLH